MKKEYCHKHKIHHERQYPSCVFIKKEIPSGSFSITLPGGTRVDFTWKGKHFSARDIQQVYKLLKLQHYYA